MRDVNGFGIAILLAMMGVAHARPTAPSVLCQLYPSAAQCRGSIAACTTCHTAAPAFNAFGAALSNALPRKASFDTEIVAALIQLEQEDTDGDGRSNAQELADGTSPGNDASRFEGPPVADGTYDYDFALTRLSAAFCGRSPSFDERQALATADSPRQFLHDRLSACLEQDYWRREVIVHLADPLIRPIALLGHCQLTFLDFEPDYNLFTWAMTGGRDASELLTAQYYVDAQDGVLQPVDALPASRIRAGVRCSSPFGGIVTQSVPPQFRAGMLTTQQFIVNNTAGTYLPRVTAGAAYRDWLGADIAQYQALYSVAGEPRDIDHKGVGSPVCAACHATLDPLAYAFAYYYGAGGGGFGSYGRDRPEVYLQGNGATQEILDAWYENPPQPHLFGEPLGLEYQLPADESSVVRLGRKAARSDLFARHITRLVTRVVLGGEPEPRDGDEVEALWRGLRDHAFSVDALCHALIDTRAFGVPE